MRDLWIPRAPGDRCLLACRRRAWCRAASLPQRFDWNDEMAPFGAHDAPCCRLDRRERAERSTRRG